MAHELRPVPEARPKGSLRTVQPSHFKGQKLRSRLEFLKGSLNSITDQDPSRKQLAISRWKI